MCLEHRQGCKINVKRLKRKMGMKKIASQKHRKKTSSRFSKHLILKKKKEKHKPIIAFIKNKSMIHKVNSKQLQDNANV